MEPSESPCPFHFSQIEDKLQFLKACIEQVEGQLSRRQKQKQAFLSELEQKICEVQTSIHHLDQMGDVRNNLMSRRRIDLEREIKLLERESRQQELEYWRDVVELHKELRQLKKEYRAVRAGALCSKQKS